MLNLICTKKGMSMVEVLIAVVLTSVAVISILSLQTSGWKTMAKSDYAGRAAEILHNRLEFYENYISNPCNTTNTTITMGAQTEVFIKTSGANLAIKGDITYTVNASITKTSIDPAPETFVVTVTVTWPGNTKGISESLAISRQEIYKFGC